MKTEHKKLIEEWSLKLKEDQDKLMQTIEETLKNSIGVIFKNHPEIEEIKINAWIPSFNDGDVCEFTTNMHYPYVNGADNGELSNIVGEYLKNIDELFFQLVFGVNVTVTITKDSTAIDDYDCEY
jgi:hypothetical protein